MHSSVDGVDTEIRLRRRNPTDSNTGLFREWRGLLYLQGGA